MPQHTVQGDDARVVVRPATARQMLSVGTTKFYELLGRGEFETYKTGASRMITVRSIRAYVERQLEQAGATAPAINEEQGP